MAVSKSVFLVVTLAVIVVFFIVGYVIGYFTHTKDAEDATSDALPVTFNHAPGPCHLVDGIEVGSEDMQLLPSGLAIISSGIQILHEFTSETWKKGIGKLKTFDFSKPEEGATDLTIVPTDSLDLDNFNPHGISVYHHDDTGEIYIFVVNHGYQPAMKEAVEKFKLDEEARTLMHLESIVDDEHFIMLNDLVANGPDTFFFTNFMSTRVVSEQMEELLSPEPKASIGYYDGSVGEILFDKQPASNGINMSPDGRYVYVNHFFVGKVFIFQRSDTNELVLLEDYEVGTGVDNVVVDGDYLWLGCGVLNPSIINQILKGLMTAPSQVIRLKVEDGKVTEKLEVFSNDGSLLSMSSVALHHQGGLLIGTVRSKALYCEVKYIG